MNPRTLPAALAALLLLPACQRDEVRSYRVPKEAVAPALPQAGGSMAGASMPGAGGAGAPASTAAVALTWQGAPHWQQLPAAGMRRGTFTLNAPDGSTADLAITAFPGDVGGLAANLNRWRGQIGLPPLPAAEVQATVEHIDTPHFHVDLVNYLGTTEGKPTRMIAALMEYNGETWFFKLTGPDALVAGEAANFRAFIDTVAPVSP